MLDPCIVNFAVHGVLLMILTCLLSSIITTPLQYSVGLDMTNPNHGKIPGKIQIHFFPERITIAPQFPEITEIMHYLGNGQGDLCEL